MMSSNGFRAAVPWSLPFIGAVNARAVAATGASTGVSGCVVIQWPAVVRAGTEIGGVDCMGTSFR